MLNIKNKKVAILMSTYNGEKYLGEQIESIENQTYKNITLIIRDDESTDSTLNIVKEKKNKYSNIFLERGKNLGPAKSFISILKSSDKYGDFDYYAFADQDDFWLKDKILMAVKKLDDLNNNEPNLYFSDTILVDKKLKKLNNIRKIKIEKITPLNAMIENIATGCTIVFNKKLKEYLEQVEINDMFDGFMHDDLAYKLASLTGNIIYDENSYIYYRQHENNVIGNSSNYLDKFKKRKKVLKKNVRLRSRIAKYILDKYNEIIKPEYKKDVKLIANYDTKRIFLLFNFKISRLSKIDDFLYRITIILNLL